MLRNLVARIILVWIALILVVALLGDVSIAATNVGCASADFLHIGQGARAAGFGGAFTAISDGSTATYWNPAGLSELENAEVTLGHFAWLQDITVEQAAFGLPISDGLVLGTAVTYVNYGTIEGYDVAGAPTSELSAYDLALGISLGYRFAENWSGGVTAKVVNQRLDVYSATAFAADLGLKYHGESYAVAAVITNFGSNLKFDQIGEKLPTAARLGLAVSPFDGAVVTSLDLEKRFQGDLVLRQGIQFGFSDRYYLRTGYDYLPAQNGRSLATAFSVGAGLSLGFADIDYAFTPNDKSSGEDLHRFSLVFRFAR